MVSTVLEIDLVERSLVVAPLGSDLHVQIEEDTLREMGFELRTCRTADPLDHFTALADDDRFLRLSLDEDCAKGIELTEQEQAARRMALAALEKAHEQSA